MSTKEIFGIDINELNLYLEHNIEERDLLKEKINRWLEECYICEFEL